MSATMFLHPAESAQLIASQMDQIQINSDAVDALAKLVRSEAVFSDVTIMFSLS